MPWLKLDDQFSDHPKIVEAGPMAGWLHVCGMLYCSRLLTDGFIPAGQVRKLADLDNAGELADRLVAVGLWDRADGGYQVHDYLDYNPSKNEVMSERQMRQVRKDLYADPFMTQRVKERDRNCCRYCGNPVRWNDRKGSGGGTYDHVIPDGGNSDENIVVACRGCNARKGRRTPEQAGMRLIPVSADLNPIQMESADNPSSRPVPTPVPVPTPKPVRKIAADADAPPRSRAPDDVFEALCEVCYQKPHTAISTRERGKLNTARAELRNVPDATADEVRRRGLHYAVMWPDLGDPSPTALSGNWTTLGNDMAKKGGNVHAIHQRRDEEQRLAFAEAGIVPAAHNGRIRDATRPHDLPDVSRPNQPHRGVQGV